MRKALSYRFGFTLAPILICALLWAGAIAPSASAELLPYELDPQLSLTGDCSTSTLDPVPDPSCPATTPSGRFNKPVAVAVDPYGNEFVATRPEDGNGWVDVFDDEGKFITELAGVTFPKSIAVDSKGNLYVFSGSDGTVRRYPPAAGSEPEIGKLEYKDPPLTVSKGIFVGAITVDAANDQLLVARSGSITRYGSAVESNNLLASGVSASWSEAIAVDAQRRRLYVPYCAAEITECGVKVLDADSLAEVHPPIDGSSTPAGKFSSEFGHLPIAVDEESGEVFIGDIEKAKTVYRYNSSYEYLTKLKSGAFLSNQTLQIAISNGERSGEDAFNRHHLFVPVIDTSGRVLAFRPPDQHPPAVTGVSTAAIGQSEAELRGTIDARGSETHYVFEYTTEQRFEEEEFEGATTAAEGTLPSSALGAVVKAQVNGLQPGSAYRFRLRAQNELGKATEDHNQGSFTTYADAPATSECPNQVLRKGDSAVLPDCRAYELVTPPDTNGREPKGLAAQGDTFTTVQAAPGGNAVSFRIEGGSLPGTSGTGGFNGDPYLSIRTPSGWTTALAGPSGEEATVTIPGGVSPDQGYSFWVGREEGSAVINHRETRYLRYPDGHSALIGRGSLGTDPSAQGKRIGEGGTHIVFETRNVTPAVAQQLEPDAPPTGTEAVYDRTPDEVTHVVSLLPGEVTPAAKQNATYVGSSPDGNGIAFEIGGTLYLRKDNTTTYAIGTGVNFAGVSEGGERVFYLQGGNLEAYDTGKEEVIDFSTTGDVTPVNVATDGTRAAFVSPSVLGGPNPEGEVAQAGKENLYLSAEGQVAFVATVTGRDVEGETTAGGQIDGLGLWSHVPLGQSATVAESAAASDPSRLDPDGSVLLFQSRADLTGQSPGGKAPQVYRYDSAAGRLSCLSCIPTGAVASGGGALQSYAFSSLLPSPFSPVVRVPNLTPGGARVFFESTEALVSTDTDGLRDVYEWEQEGVGSCEHAGGCTYLISSGHSKTENYLYGHSTDGNDVFFTSGDVLSDKDAGGTPSIYDARAGGGFASEQGAGECLGEACQPVVSAPDFTNPASAAFHGAGNLPAEAKSRCPKGKRRAARRGKAHCVKRHKSQKRKGNAKQGEGRPMSRNARKIAAALLASLALVLLGATSASADKDFSKYAIESASASLSSAQAGAHADFTNSFVLSATNEATPHPYAYTRDVLVRLPPGLFGNPQAIPQCTLAEFSSGLSACAQDSQVGVAEVQLAGSVNLTLTEPIYNMDASGGDIAARFGFYAAIYPVLVNVRLDPADNTLVAAVEGAAAAAEPISVTTTFWGVPADESHDPLRLTPAEGLAGKLPPGGRKSGRPPVPFMTNPTDCLTPKQLTFTAISYQIPDSPSTMSTPFPGIGGCELVEFNPDASAAPTTTQGSSPSGLGFDLQLPTKGLESPKVPAGLAATKRAEVTLPEGMTVNPSQAVGLGVCTEADLARETYNSAPDAGCPETSKVGSVLARTPVLDRNAEGSLYIAKPYENPFNSLLALYMVLKVPDRGIAVKLAGRVSLDPQTGQITTVFDDIPQLPVSSFELHFREGARSPLITPPACGPHSVVSNFTPWAAPGKVTTRTSSFKIESGPDHGPCPAGGLPPFHPSLVAGTLNNAAGSFSPFNARLTRTDTEQEFTNFSLKLPPGVAGKLAGIPYCSDEAIARATSRSGPHGGAEESAGPSCPAASQVGSTLAGAGVGQVLAYAPGKVYLAGPYHGAPISLVAITSGVVGPFDIGTVVVRLAVKVNPESGEVFLDATGSDPIPHIVRGVVLHLRDIRAYADKPNFTYNPTNCTPTSTAATALGSGLDFVSPADDNPFVSTSPFQAADCAALPFSPKLTLSLSGATKRGGYPKLKAFLRMRGFGEAGISRAQVTLPRSEFIANAHFNTICTRVQFKAAGGNGEACPAGSIYGWARAKTPVLADPLEGPVFLRSSEHQLPDVVASLRGQQIDVHLVGHVDSVKGQLRNTFETVPDAPVEWASFSFQGGKKGLFENSTDLCAKANRADVRFSGQNGKTHNYRPAVKVKCRHLRPSLRPPVE